VDRPRGSRRQIFASSRLCVTHSSRIARDLARVRFPPPPSPLGNLHEFPAVFTPLIEQRVELLDVCLVATDEAAQPESLGHYSNVVIGDGLIVDAVGGDRDARRRLVVADRLERPLPLSHDPARPHATPRARPRLVALSAMARRV
jgi:hypothetical protein